MKTLDSMSVPIIQGGMGIGISMGGLAGAVAAEGGMGVISTANIGFREDDFYTNTQEADRRALIKEIEKAREISCGRGLIAINVMVATTNAWDMVEIAASHGIDAVISGAGLPLELPGHVEGADVLIAPVVSSGKAARLMCRSWARNHDRQPDFIVIEGSEAGGHLGFKEEQMMAGTADPLENILKDVLEAAPGIPTFVAGGVFGKNDIKRFMALGAAGVQIATRFIATEECDATQGFKDIIIGAAADDAEIIISPVGMPGRALKTPLMDKVAAGTRVGSDKCIGCIRTCRHDTTPYCINRALINAYYGNFEEGLFFCGSNVGKVGPMTTVKKLMKELR